MFFNLGPFSFGLQQPPRPPRHPNQQPNRNNQGGLFGGIGDFLQQQFMNPFFAPPNNNQAPHQQQPRPAFHRGSSKKQSEKKEKDKNKKQQQKPKTVYNENTGMYWKQKANEQFKKGNNQTALKYYTKAIEMNNSQSVFFSNRARCFKKISKFEEALKDAQQAVQLDSDNIKGHLLCGQILAQLGKRKKEIKKVASAVTRLTKALTLCVGQNKDNEFQQQIGTYIYRAKKLHWYLKFEQIKQRRIQAINQYKSYLEKDEKMTKEQAQNKLKQFIEASNESIVFQIPDYLTCRITLDLMEDPVVTDSGQVYERSAIQQHIQRNGKTDPFTRKPISGTLYPCIAIKKAIQDFLQKNPWAYQYSEGESYHDINF